MFLLWHRTATVDIIISVVVTPSKILVEDIRFVLLLAAVVVLTLLPARSGSLSCTAIVTFSLSDRTFASNTRRRVAYELLEHQ